MSSGEFLAIKNWDKYQPGRKGKSTWVKDWTDKDNDHAYAALTCFQRYILDGCCRLRGRFGRDLPNDSTYIARALCVCSTERPCVPHAISTLIARGFLVLINQQVNSSIHKNKEEEKKREEEDAQALPHIALAQKVASECLLPRNPGMLQAVAGAIEFCVKAEGRTNNGAVEFLIAESKGEIARGRSPTKFWFDDRKWLKTQESGKKSKLQERLDAIDKMEL